MTFREFEMHRPRLAVGLADQLSNWTEDWRPKIVIEPRYADGIRFVAAINGEALRCFGPGHPLFNEADDGPGCAGTWWWEYDMPAEARK